MTLESVLAKKITAASLMSSDSITAVRGVLLSTCLPGDLFLSLSLLFSYFFWDNRGIEVEANSSKTTSGTEGGFVFQKKRMFFPSDHSVDINSREDTVTAMETFWNCCLGNSNHGLSEG